MEHMKYKCSNKNIGQTQRRYYDLPTMHCSQWDILYRWSCGSLEMKHTLGIRRHLNLSFQVGSAAKDPHDHLYNKSHWKQCIVGRSQYLIWDRPLKQYYKIYSKVRPLRTFKKNFYHFHKSIEHWEQTISRVYESYMSYDRICNYLSFTRIPVNLILQYYLLKAVFRIFQVYAKQPICVLH